MQHTTQIFKGSSHAGFVVLLIMQASGTAIATAQSSGTFTATGSSGGAPTSGGPQTSLQTSNAVTNFYNNQWVTISVALPANYGTGGVAPTPPGETQPGWWKIEYTVGTSG